jgi:hypothetical protein
MKSFAAIVFALGALLYIGSEAKPVLVLALTGGRRRR